MFNTCTPQQKDVVVGMVGIEWVGEKFVWPELLEK